MKQVSEMPTSGQFIMVWIDGEGLCADTKVYDKNGFLCSLTLDRPVDRNTIIQGAKGRNAQYFIADYR